MVVQRATAGGPSGSSLWGHASPASSIVATIIEGKGANKVVATATLCATATAGVALSSRSARCESQRVVVDLRAWSRYAVAVH